MAYIWNQRARRCIGLLAALVVALQGCAVNPYSQNPRPTEPELAAARVVNGRPPARGTLEYEFLRADALSARYQRMLSDEFDRQQKISGTLIGLGTAALGAALFKAHSDVLLALATGGVLTYQLGTWNSNDNRLNIYLEGMKAVACLKGAVEPLHISELQLTRIAALSSDTQAQVDATAEMVGEVTRWLAVTGGETGAISPLRQTAASELTEASALMNQANDLLASQAGLANRVEGAGHLMERKLDDIDRAVNAALRGTLANLSALPAFIGDAANYTSIVVPGLKADVAFSGAVAAANGKISGQGPTAQYGALTVSNTPTEALAHSLGRLREERAKLARTAKQLGGALAGIAALTQVRSAVDGCNLDTTRLAAALAIERPELVFKPGEKVRKEVAISGGTRPYAARFQEVPAKGFRADVPPGAAVVYIESDGDARAGNVYHVRVSDATLAGVQLTVRVEDHAGTQDSGGNPKDKKATTAAPKCTGQEGRSVEELCLTQKVTGAKVDGKFGPNSCAAFIQSAVTSSFGGLVNDQAMAAVKAAASLQPKATAAEMRAKLTPAEQSACRLSGVPVSVAGPADVPVSGTTTAPGTASMAAATAANAANPASGAASAAATAASGVSSASAAGSRCDPIPTSAQCKVPLALARCQFECVLTENEIRRLRTKLGLKDTPASFDPDLRESLIRFQQQRHLPLSGEYNEDTARALSAGG